MALQNGTRVEVRNGSYRSELGSVVGSQRPFVVVELERDPAIRLAVLHEDVAVLDERNERSRRWKEVA